jgi:hypothetical protein
LQGLEDCVAYHHFKFFGKCPIWNLYLLGVLNTQGLEMPSKVDSSENDMLEMHHIGNYE